MKIGELSKEAGVKVGTIRFYERRKLLKPPVRTSSGYRSYVPQDVKVVKGIKQLQELGFTLREIKNSSTCTVLRHAYQITVRNHAAFSA